MKGLQQASALHGMGFKRFFAKQRKGGSDVSLGSAAAIPRCPLPVRFALYFRRNALPQQTTLRAIRRHHKHVPAVQTASALRCFRARTDARIARRQLRRHLFLRLGFNHGDAATHIPYFDDGTTFGPLFGFFDRIVYTLHHLAETHNAPNLVELVEPI